VAIRCTARVGMSLKCSTLASRDFSNALGSSHGSLVSVIIPTFNSLPICGSRQPDSCNLRQVVDWSSVPEDSPILVGPLR
jgi:hypothetical protein